MGFKAEVETSAIYLEDYLLSLICFSIEEESPGLRQVEWKIQKAAIVGPPEGRGVLPVSSELCSGAGRRYVGMSNLGEVWDSS